MISNVVDMRHSLFISVPENVSSYALDPDQAADSSAPLAPYM